MPTCKIVHNHFANVKSQTMIWNQRGPKLSKPSLDIGHSSDLAHRFSEMANESVMPVMRNSAWSLDVFLPKNWVSEVCAPTLHKNETNWLSRSSVQFLPQRMSSWRVHISDIRSIDVLFYDRLTSGSSIVVCSRCLFRLWFFVFSVCQHTVEINVSKPVKRMK